MNTVIEVREQHQRRTSKRTKDGETSIRLYHVTFDKEGGTPEAAETADDGTRSIPAYGSQLEDTQKLLTEIKADPVNDSRRLFAVLLTYKTVPEEGAGGSGHPDPLQRPPDIAWSTNKYQRVLEKDVNGAAIVNSAGDPFDPPLMETISIPVVEIGLNRATYDPDDYMPFVDSVNDAVMTIAALNNIPIKGAWMEDIKHRSRYENGVSFQRINFTIETAGSYLREVLDRGWHRVPDGAEEEEHYLGGGVFQKVEITNADGTQPNRPVRLNGAGQPLANNAAPVFLSYETKDPLDWVPLDLPEAI